MAIFIVVDEATRTQVFIKHVDVHVCRAWIKRKPNPNDYVIVEKDPFYESAMMEFENESEWCAYHLS